MPVRLFKGISFRELSSPKLITGAYRSLLQRTGIAGQALSCRSFRVCSVS